MIVRLMETLGGAERKCLGTTTVTYGTKQVPKTLIMYQFEAAVELLHGVSGRARQIYDRLHGVLYQTDSTDPLRLEIMFDVLIGADKLYTMRKYSGVGRGVCKVVNGTETHKCALPYVLDDRSIFVALASHQASFPPLCPDPTTVVDYYVIGMKER